MTEESRLKGASGRATKNSPPPVDFATALFTGDLFGELTGSLPVLTLDIPSRVPEVTDPARPEGAEDETSTAHKKTDHKPDEVGLKPVPNEAGISEASTSEASLSEASLSEASASEASASEASASEASASEASASEASASEASASEASASEASASEASASEASSPRAPAPGNGAGGLLLPDALTPGVHTPGLRLAGAADSGERALYGVNQPAFERITLSHDRVRVRIAGRSPSEAIEGHLADASVSGLLIRVPAKPTLPTEDVELVLGLAGGLEVTFAARVVRATSSSVAVQYFAGDSTLRFRLRFMAEALTQLDAPPWIEIKARRSDASQETRFDRETREMAVLWSHVLEDFENKDKHQTFLNACIKASRLDYGLERYRIYKRENREADVDEYLKQIGTILGFFVLSRAPDDDTEASRSRKRTATIALVIALSVLALLVAQEMISKMSVTEDRTKATMRSTQPEK
ncbi:MAG: PilZ domain-containing protein [Deltaproteobacteria bacterium]|nr:PilZ domain-containing protein [Deltaproteobacteria bacterium]